MMNQPDYPTQTAAEHLVVSKEALLDLPLTVAKTEAVQGGDGRTVSAGEIPWQASLQTPGR
jgi:hypothetical protein